MSYPRTTAWKTSLMIVATREQANKNESTLGKLNRWMCKDVG